MKELQILAVDDETAILELLRYNLEKESWRVDTAESGEQALSMLDRKHYDLVILDLMLPGIDGLQVCSRIKSMQQGPPVLMLTARTEDPDIITGLNVGADDYVTKPFSPKVLVARIRALVRRPAASQEQTDHLCLAHGISLDSRRYEVKVDGQIVELSATEFAILEILMRNPGWVFGRSKIIDAVKGSDYPVTERSVDVQILGLRRKLGAKGDCIQTVRGVGYRLAALP